MILLILTINNDGDGSLERVSRQARELLLPVDCNVDNDGIDE